MLIRASVSRMVRPQIVCSEFTVGRIPFDRIAHAVGALDRPIRVLADFVPEKADHGINRYDCEHYDCQRHFCFPRSFRSVRPLTT
jgi:hypothetical protein